MVTVDIKSEFTSSPLSGLDLSFRLKIPKLEILHFGNLKKAFDWLNNEFAKVDNISFKKRNYQYVRRAIESKEKYIVPFTIDLPTDSGLSPSKLNGNIVIEPKPIY